MIDTWETLEAPGVGELPLTGVQWGGTIGAGVPSGILDARRSAISGSADISLPVQHLGRAVDEDTWPGLQSGVDVVLRAYRDGEVAAALKMVLTGVVIKWDKITVTFSNERLSLSNRVRVAPLAGWMPEGWNMSWDAQDPWAKDLGKVSAAPSVNYAVFQAFRTAGYNCVPPILPSTLVDLPLQWCTVTNEWDERSGHTFTSTAYGRKTASASWVARDGMSWLSDGTVWCGTTTLKRSPKVRDVQGHFMVGPGANGNSGVTVLYGANNWVTFDVRPDGSLRVSTSRGDSYESQPKSVVQLVKFWVSGASKQWRFQTAGDVHVGKFEPLASANNEKIDTFTGIHADASPGGRLAGVQVNALPYKSLGTHYLDEDLEYPLQSFPQNVFIHNDLTGWYSGFYMPGVRDNSARAVLDAVSDAVGGSWWVDEENNARFCDMKYLLKRGPAHLLSFDSDVVDYEITEQDSTIRDAVEVRYSEVGYSRNQRPRVNVWEGPGDRLGAGDTAGYMVEPGPDEDWLAVDWGLRWYLALPGIQPAYEGSWISAYDDKNNKPFVYDYDWECRTITPWLAAVDIKARGDMVLGGASGVVESKMKFPIFRARGKMMRADAMKRVGSSHPKSPYQHDASKWVTSAAAAERLGSFLLFDLPAQKAGLSYFVSQYRPDIRLGQVLRIGAGVSSARERRALVVGVSHNPDKNATALNVFELSSTRRNIVWREAESAAEDSTPSSFWDRLEPTRVKGGTKWSKVESDSTAYPWGV